MTCLAPWRTSLERHRIATGSAVASIVCLVVTPAAGELVFTPPLFLPGDTAVGASVGMQVDPDLALGDGQFLAVWSDGRTSPDDYWPFATEGSGTDIYGARVDAAGNVIDGGSLVINQDFGDQNEPTVGWNGQNWLVVWKQDTATLPVYEELRATRVAPDGTVLDTLSIVIHSNQSYYDWDGAVVEGGNGEWVVLFQANGPAGGLRAVRVDGDGSVVNPGGLQVHDTTFGLDFDLAYAGDEYLVVWEGSFDSPRGRRYTLDLQPLGTTALPFAQRVDSDGTDFLVVRASGPPPLATVDAVRVMHDGSRPDPSFTIFTAGNQSGTCCANVAWDGTYYWATWGQLALARVTPDGQLLDPGGLQLPPPAAWPMSSPRFAGAPAGGLQMVWNNGVNGAAYPKDTFTGRVSDTGMFSNETLLSGSVPAQLDSDLAEGAGMHLVVFRSRGSDIGRILVQRIDAAGITLDPEPIEVASGPIPGLGLPSLGEPSAAWNGSLFMITWSDGLSIFARRMLPDGTFIDATPLTVMDGHDPDVAAVGEVFLVVGLDFLSNNPQWQATHSMRVDGATGVNLDPEPNALGGFVIFARHPHVVSWGDRWLVVWQQNLSHDSTIAGTTAAIVTADGTTPGIIDVPLGWRPQVAVSESEALFVAVTNTIASATTDLAGVIMAPDGTFPGSWFTISDAPEKQLMPAVTWNGSEFIAVWEDKRNAVIYFDERTDIYGSRIATDGTVLDPSGVPVAATSVPEVKPALLSIGNVTLLSASTFRPERALGAYRIGIQVDAGAVSVGDSPVVGGTALRILGVRPNPTRSSSTIRFELAAGDPVTARIFDADGRLVRTLVEHGSLVGPAALTWDGRDDTGRQVGSGVFFYELRTRSATASGRVVMVD